MYTAAFLQTNDILDDEFSQNQLISGHNLSFQDHKRDCSVAIPYTNDICDVQLMYTHYIQEQTRTNTGVKTLRNNHNLQDHTKKNGEII